jgi:hypothetical protein
MESEKTKVIYTSDFSASNQLGVRVGIKIKIKIKIKVKKFKN